MDVSGAVVTALWVMLPAYVPNNAAVLAGGGRPIDGGRTLGGQRVLGDGKTWQGTAAGWAAGTAVAFVLTRLHESAGDLLGAAVPAFPLPVVFALPLGAMLGDIAASFLKRRTGRERGAAVPGLDQLDFVVGALVLAAVTDPGWTTDHVTVPVLVVVLVVTPVLHVTANAAAYALGLKDEPW